MDALIEALGARAGMCVAVVGAGGKTTLCWRLTQALAAAGEQVIFTTTTRIWQPAEGAFDRLCLGSPDDVLRQLRSAANWQTACLAQGVEGQPDTAPVHDAAMPCVRTKLIGFSAEAIADLKTAFEDATLVVEADGARGLLVKAPGPHEPAIPPCTDLVCVLASLDAVGRPLDNQTVHRAARAAQLAGARLADPITPAMLGRLLTHPEGGLKGIPAAARRVAVLTQRAADAPLWVNALMAALREGGFERVVVLALRAAQPVLATS